MSSIAVVPDDPRGVPGGEPSAPAGAPAGSVRRRTLLLVVAASALARLVFALAVGPLTFPDSWRYLGGIDLVGTDGNPAPLVQAVWMLDATLALAIQVLLASAAWGLLALVAAQLPSSRRWAWAVALGVLAWSWNPLALSFDAAAMTESLTLTAVLSTTTAAFLLVVPRLRGVLPSRVTVGLLVGGAVAAMLSRPVAMVLVLPLVGVVALLRWFRTRAERRELRVRRRDMRRNMTGVADSWRSYRPSRRALAAAGVLLVVAGWAGASQLDGNRVNGPLYASNTLAWRGTTTVLAAARAEGMPACPQLPPAAMLDLTRDSWRVHRVGPLVWREPSIRFLMDRKAILTRCPAVARWLSGAPAVTAAWVASAPDEALDQYLSDLPVQWMAPAVFSWSPTTIAREAAVRLVVDVAAALVLVASFGFVAATWLRGQVPGRWRRRRGFAGSTWSAAAPGTGAVLLLVAGMMGSWGLYSMVAWFGDAMELGRHFLPIPLLGVPVALLAAGALLRTSRGSSGPPHAARRTRVPGSNASTSARLARRTRRP